MSEEQGRSTGIYIPPKGRKGNDGKMHGSPEMLDLFRRALTGKGGDDDR